MGSTEVRVETVHGKALVGNPLGDPVDRRLHVVLPPHYDTTTDRLPLVMLLAGFAGSGASFLDYRVWDEPLPDMIDRLLAEGRIRPMILILPDAMTRYGGSQYLNSEATGRYQDYLVDLVEWSDSHFRTRATPEARAIAGKSSGGFGALRMVMDRPGIFGLVADVSGDKYFDYAYGPSLPRVQRALQAFPELEKALADPRSFQPHDQTFRDIMEMAALASCYSPNPASPYGFDFPFDLETGARRDEIWERWLAHDPVRRVDRAADVLRNLSLLYLECGRRDEFYLNVGMRLFHQRLEALGIEHTYREHDGGHFNLHGRWAHALEAISHAIS